MVDSFPFAGARWIGSGDSLGNWDNPVLPAPFFRTEFVCGKERDTPARVALCGLGYYELYINGRRVGDQVLDPVFSQYDRHCRYVIFDVTEYLLPGTNCVGVILGNGWYNSHVIGWHFDKAPWREYPKLLLALSAEKFVSLAFFTGGTDHFRRHAQWRTLRCRPGISRLESARI